MKNILVIIWAMFSLNVGFAQTDSIFLVNGKCKVCKVIKFNVNDITLNCSNQKTSILITDVRSIKFSNGQVFNEPFKEYYKILITDSNREVEGLKVRGHLSAKSAIGALTEVDAIRDVTIKIQKQAFDMNAVIFLITKKDKKINPDGTVEIKMNGIAYSF